MFFSLTVTMNAFLKGAIMVVRKMVDENLTVCVQSTGPSNWGHLILASIAQLMMDPYYRTLEGICVLIEKDWVAMRYPFESM